MPSGSPRLRLLVHLGFATLLPLTLSALAPADDPVTVADIQERAPEMNQESVHLWRKLMFGLFLLCSDHLWPPV